ncbi:RHS repeat domain-containing protein [Parabacteroides sp. AM08-6]|uniref:RHS repeat domain-containing protein n=1 Tax=Parabacteroides sp. AM08-6 TaxID=2292053 RepID=UPI000EFE18BD|nr:DUF6443 domain-containing protein [Parabacteroides sp. AM08-6]RHJ83936.1 RHS repeat-associated core domain-containing protein [Parabacteroides sp. AM08-6]
MKTYYHILSVVLFVLPCSGLSGQTTSQNFVRTRTMTTSTSSYLDHIEYLDGLGRLSETVETKQGGSGQDLVSLIDYDNAGREEKLWLPVPVSGNNGAYVSPSTLRSNASTAHAGDSYPYRQLIYEASPLERVRQDYGPGSSWRSASRSVESVLLVNSSSLSCGKYTVSNDLQTISLVRSGTYATGELSVRKTTDEDGHISYEFKDKSGRTVLTRQMDGSTSFDTYYVYDCYDNLRVVLPPLASDALSPNGTYTESTDAIKKYAYLYKYDKHFRPIAKKLPGAEWIYIIYDKAGRVIFTQDGVQRSKNQWTFTIPDAFDRVVLTGTCTNSLSYGSEPLKNTLVNAVRASGGSYKGYNLSGTSLSSATLLSVTYYDDYSFTSENLFPSGMTFESRSGYASSNLSTPKGLPTGSITGRTDSNSQYTYTVYYYDARSRLIQTRRTNHVGGTDHEYVAYAFDGLAEKRYHQHTAFGSTKTEEYVYTYDAARRLTKTTHSWNGGTAKTLSEKSYDALGRISTDKKGGLSSLEATYGYDVRSRLVTQTGNLFSQTLTYTYGGDISKQEWRQSGMGHTYSYTYDGLSRLNNAVYSGLSYNFTTSYTYDKHGNPTGIQRNGMTNSGGYGQIDKLSFTYDGNRITSVNDLGENVSYSFSHDFKNYANQSEEYVYDQNGNITKDLNKGISLISYNYMNQPLQINIKSPVAEACNEYVYGSDGTKYQVVHKWNPAYSNTPIIGSGVNISALTQMETTDYVGNYIYIDGTLKRVLLEGGYLGERDVYCFYVTDHLGNNRIVANNSGASIQSVQYYPYGMQLGNITGSNAQPYKYSGKEYDDMHGLNLYDSQSRLYDPALGRFMTMDPLSEKYYSWSTYGYCMNNPMKFVDPDGKVIRLANNYIGGIENIARIAATSLGSRVMSRLIEQKDVYTLNSIFWTIRSSYNPKSLDINYVGNPWYKEFPVDGGILNSMIILGHETFHAFDHSSYMFNSANAEYSTDIVEPRAVSFENYLRQAYSLSPLRERYGNIKGNFHQFFGNEKISNFKTIGHNSDKTSYGFSYIKNTKIVENYKTLFGIKTPDKTRIETSTCYMIVSMDENRNVFFKTFNNEDAFRKETYNW